MTESEPDPLFAALRALPRHAPAPEVKAQQEAIARAAYVQSSAPDTWHSPLGAVGRVLMPVFLASVVGLYLSWAIGAATALLR